MEELLQAVFLYNLKEVGCVPWFNLVQLSIIGKKRKKATRNMGQLSEDLSITRAWKGLTLTCVIL